MSARVVSVNVGTPVDVPWAGAVGRTAIRKQPTTGPVRVHALGLEGDEVADKRDHGGIDQAVYAFAQEDLDYWTEELGERVPPALFGENLTTSGIDVNEAQLGEQWRIGPVLLQVSSVRIPCSTFQNHLALEGFDETGWVKRFTAQRRPGPYLRVVEEGTLSRRGRARRHASTRPRCHRLDDVRGAHHRPVAAARAAAGRRSAGLGARQGARLPRLSSLNWARRSAVVRQAGRSEKAR